MAEAAFKAPSIFEKVKNVPSSDEKNTTCLSTPEKNKKSCKAPIPFPYQEPEWGGIPPFTHSFEIIKNGTLIKKVDIRSSYFVFGRLDSVCNIVFEHPSVSRFHAVLQYSKGDDIHPKGFYLYDLGSTNGTFLNKKKLDAKAYYKIKVGSFVKIGFSSRLHIFQGPEEEDEPELSPAIPKSEDQSESCGWGMGEDAPMEEEDLSENPFALSTNNEELYLDDPKKTLRSWFEREGYELEYKVEEKGFRTFVCSVELPVDTPTGEYMHVEASVSGGKKKEAVIACALEACRTLDRLGVLRSANHESRRQKIRKKWEENDYYDSDEDTFYDRTGQIEKRREMRKRLAEKKPEVQTFKSVQAKLEALNSEIDSIKKRLSVHEDKSPNAVSSSEGDTLESFMAGLKDSTVQDKFEKRKLKLRLIEAEKERSHLEKLSAITKPTSLPPLAKNPGMIGKKLKSKLNLSKMAKPVLKSESSTNEVETAVVEEEESDSEMMDTQVEVKETTSQEQESVSDSNSELTENSQRYGLILNVTEEKEVKHENVSHTKAEDSEQSVSATKICNNIVMDTEPDAQEVKPSSQNKKQKYRKRQKKEADVYVTETEDYCTWVPPSGQTGDGMTSLNEKYGY